MGLVSKQAWENDFKKIGSPEWTRIAKDRIKWKALEEAFNERQAEIEKPATNTILTS